jgi:CRP/FNR family transcriptional regulator, cyclic AMP receptor protein
MIVVAMTSVPEFEKPPEMPGATRLAERQHAGGSSAAEHAAVLLCAPKALNHLTLEHARVVVAYMQPTRIAEGTVFIRQGDGADTDDMYLVIDGEVTVETTVVSRTQPVTVTVLGAGSLIGELGLLDGEPRSASCTATSRLQCAKLTRAALEELIEDAPQTGARLMMAVGQRIAERLRDSADKLKLYSQLVQAMQGEIDRLMPTR